METELDQSTDGAAFQDRATRVYRYGLLPPTERAELVREQMMLAARYRNTLVEIQRGYRAALRAMEGERVRDLQVAAEQARDAAKAAADQARNERARTGKRSNSPEVKAVLAAAKARAKAARVALSEERSRIRKEPDIINARDVLSEREKELRLNARHYSGLCHGTYSLIEEQVRSACKSPLYAGLEPNDPRWKRFTGEGAVGVQVKNGATIDDLAEHTFVRVSHVVDRSGRDRFRELWLRVGSDAHRGPVWARWPMLMHRPLPAGARIKFATVSRVLRGPYEEWSALFTVDEPGAEPRSGDRVVGVDLGWRARRDGSVRVAVWRDEAGESGEIVLTAHQIAGLRKAAEIESIRARPSADGSVVGFDGAVALVRQIRDEVSTPEWFSTATVTAHAWRSEARLASLVRRWRYSRWDGDSTVFAALDAWERRDHHLWHYESGQRIGGLRMRRDVYRVAAARLAERYDVVVLESFDLRTFARKPMVGREEHQKDKANDTRHLVAPSEFRLALKNAFVARGGRVVEVSAVETTMRCHVCGLVEVFDAAASVRHTCSAGHEWDQDVNAAANLIERWRSAPDPGPAREENPAEKEPRWAKARRLRAEKLARMAAARNPADKAAE